MSTRRKSCRLLVCLIISALTFVIIFKWNSQISNNEDIVTPPSKYTNFLSPSHPSRPVDRNLKKNNKSESRKLILLWTPSFGGYNVRGWGIFNDTLTNCTFKCEFTTDRNLSISSDAIIYHFAPGLEVTHPLPSHRSEETLDQLWIFYHVESPITQVFKKTSFDGLFNWTMTYRHDSDVIWPASGYTLRFNSDNDLGSNGSRVTAYQKLVESLPTKKSLTIGWMNSHCKTASQRENLVSELVKFNITVDIYGECGPLNCSQSADCYGILSKKYKYWLAFENSICADYVTEKMFYAQRVGMLPIVYGDSASFRQIALSQSYIDILDFSSLKDFAENLHLLDSNVKEYLKYFEWMKKWRILNGLEIMSRNWCNLCTKLHQHKSNHKKWYKSVYNWFYKNETHTFQCKTPGISSEGNGTVQFYTITKVFDNHRDRLGI